VYVGRVSKDSLWQHHSTIESSTLICATRAPCMSKNCGMLTRDTLVPWLSQRFMSLKKFWGRAIMLEASSGFISPQTALLRHVRLCDVSNDVDARNELTAACFTFPTVPRACNMVQYCRARSRLASNTEQLHRGRAFLVVSLLTLIDVAMDSMWAVKVMLASPIWPKSGAWGCHCALWIIAASSILLVNCSQWVSSHSSTRVVMAMGICHRSISRMSSRGVVSNNIT
jgi:hypothetical protein